ncbi:hypothetical protein Sste5346_002120 [Sporothrix stenoceras]|uniref:Uncharacterized protein n=1 Tax=Sporothrix stenoceras TaxID=5173 RepID=A0ABR3ZJZ3_9PEZI
MEDPDIAWPAWKFGMKRDALFTTLHKQYNTFQSTIQDPDAFHHDVFEIASEASTTGEFHHLLAIRRDQRLRELNESLESASFEIIANPNLVGTTQWEFALQLFRTRSLDSLVRYFASYLPSSHPWHKPTSSGPVEAKCEQTVASTKPFFDDTIITHEPTMMSHSLSHTSLHHDLPPSPRSLTTYSDDMETSSHQLYCLNTLTPARTLSLDSYEGGRLHDDNNHTDDVIAVNDNEDDDEEFPSQFDDDTSQSSGPYTPVSMSDAEPDVAEDHEHHHHHNNPAVAYVATMQELVNAATPKPKTPPTTIAKNPIDTIKTITQHEAITNTTTPATNSLTTDVTIDTVESTATNTTSSPYRRPLQSGLVADTPRPASPLPVSMRVRHRSVSPSSRPWPVVHADTGRHHLATSSGITATRSSRQGRLHRLENLSSSSSSITRSASSCGRRRQGLGVEKTVLPRPMRTRLRERREAAASAAAEEQERQ